MTRFLDEKEEAKENSDEEDYDAPEIVQSGDQARADRDDDVEDDDEEPLTKRSVSPKSPQGSKSPKLSQSPQ